MNENPQVKGTPGGTGSSAAIGFAIGAVVGAAVALLLAPASGRDTRRRLAEVGRRVGGAARTKFDEARDTVNDLKQDAKAALEAGREAFEHGQHAHEPQPASRIEPKGKPVEVRSADPLTAR